MVEGRKGPHRMPSMKERRAEVASLELEPDLLEPAYGLMERFRGLERQVIDVLAVAKSRGMAREYIERFYEGIMLYRVERGARYNAELLLDELYGELGMKRKS